MSPSDRKKVVETVRAIFSVDHWAGSVLRYCFRQINLDQYENWRSHIPSPTYRVEEWYRSIASPEEKKARAHYVLTMLKFSAKAMKIRISE